MKRDTVQSMMFGVTRTELHGFRTVLLMGI